MWGYLCTNVCRGDCGKCNCAWLCLCMCLWGYACIYILHMCKCDFYVRIYMHLCEHDYTQGLYMNVCDCCMCTNKYAYLYVCACAPVSMHIWFECDRRPVDGHVCLWRSVQAGVRVQFIHTRGKWGCILVATSPCGFLNLSFPELRSSSLDDLCATWWRVSDFKSPGTSVPDSLLRRHRPLSLESLTERNWSVWESDRKGSG